MNHRRIESLERWFGAKPLKDAASEETLTDVARLESFQEILRRYAEPSEIQRLMRMFAVRKSDSARRNFDSDWFREMVREWARRLRQVSQGIGTAE